MKKTTLLSLTPILLLFLFAGCSPKIPTPSPDEVIRQSVAATIAAIPIPTQAPLPTPYPSPTPFSLAGLFCEYQFCIGHPTDISFFDISAQQNPTTPSTYNQGVLAAFNANLFLQVMWQTSPGTSNPQFLLDLMIDDAKDAAQGNKDIKLVRNMNVVYTSISTTASPFLPFGGAGAWTCGDRVFAWKIYTPDAASANTLFEEALKRFTCGQ
ncbi:MAG: hypothetical protein U0Z26_18050 [Anaerolineales bacterium]